MTYVHTFLHINIIQWNTSIIKKQTQIYPFFYHTTRVVISHIEQMDTSFLESLSSKIHALDESHHLPIATILRKDIRIKMNENSGGIMVNLSLVDKDTIQEIVDFLDFLSEQEKQINNMQNETDRMREQMEAQGYK